mgnify:CR=1 FL=1
MKKITLFILTIFTVATLFAAARPSLDGRAVVAESGTMPRGLFARTVGYLPGDSVTVTNPATGSTIDVLILGAIDPSEGVAILLSPEAAEGLRIKPDSNVQVKLTKRAGSLDENANGTAVLSEEDSSESAGPVISESPVASETPAAKENVPSEIAETENTPVENIPSVAENPAVAETEVPVEAVEETPVLAETETDYEEIPVIAENPVEKDIALVPEKVENVPEKPASEKKEQKVVGTVYEELPPLPEDEVEKVVVIETEKDESLENVTEEVAMTGDEIVSEEAVPVSEAEKLVPVVVVETEKVNPDENEDLQPVLEELPVVAETESNESEEVYEELPEGIESEPSVVAEETPEEDAYQPIVLVPTEMNPPEAEEKAEDTPVVASAVEETKPVVTNDWTNYVVPSIKNLRSGYYYVQVASLGSAENIKNIVDKYSNKYPLVLVQNASKSAYQVMVGPLNIDEYGSVDEKFKAYGFKDAFVRKIR